MTPVVFQHDITGVGMMSWWYFMALLTGVYDTVSHYGTGFVCVCVKSQSIRMTFTMLWHCTYIVSEWPCFSERHLVSVWCHSVSAWHVQCSFMTLAVCMNDTVLLLNTSMGVNDTFLAWHIVSVHHSVSAWHLQCCCMTLTVTVHDIYSPDAWH